MLSGLAGKNGDADVALRGIELAWVLPDCQLSVVSQTRTNEPARCLLGFVFDPSLEEVEL